ncbi:MAG TPA: hypothetical protein PKB10_09420 [Tepidisphaeraceae bacterium]|nr:hypothetical protein [Tepidisphaeraceae bacterium]
MRWSTVLMGFAGSVALPITSAQAAFVAPASWVRGAGGATYQHWDVFDAYPVDPTPDVGNINPNGTAVLTETTGAAFVTSGGNIYSFSTATQFSVSIPELDVPAPAHDLTAVVQFKTLGTEIDPASVLLNGIAPVDTAELSRVGLGGFGGSAVQSWYLFNVPYAAFGSGTAGATSVTLTFAAAGSSMSLDQVSIDTAIRPFGYYPEPNPVPEPAMLSLAALVAPALLRRRRG